ncbi:MAG: DUF4437 domain-containing protein [Rhodospirillales bacterium]|nr:DUF4437 domain-containing protein [Rhodospirillales bacterium]
MSTVRSIVVALMGAWLSVAFSAQADESVVLVTPDDVEWREVAPGAALARLWGDPENGAYVRLIKVPAGVEGSTHWHSGDVHAFGVSGAWLSVTEGDPAGAREMSPGSYLFHAGGTVHSNTCIGPVECVLLVWQPVAHDVIPAE